MICCLTFLTSSEGYAGLAIQFALRSLQYDSKCVTDKRCWRIGQIESSPDAHAVQSGGISPAHPQTSLTSIYGNNLRCLSGLLRSTTPPVLVHVFAALFASFAKVLVVDMPTPTGIWVLFNTVFFISLP